MTTENFVNVGESTLAVAAASTDLTVTLASASPFNVPGQFRIRLDDSLQQSNGVATRYEICRASFNAGNVLNAYRTGIDSEGTTAQAWPIGTKVASIITAGGLNNALAGQYKAKARNTSNQAFGTATGITLTSIDYDPNGNFSANTYVCPVAGFYLVIGKLLAYSINAGLSVDAMIYRSGAELDRASITSGAISSPTAIVSGVYWLAAGDGIRLYANISAGTGSSWSSVTMYSSLSVHCLST